MSEIVKYNNDFNLLPMPELKAIQMDMFMAIISLTKEKQENTPFLKKFFDPDKRKIIIPQKTFIELCRLKDSKMNYKEIFHSIDNCLKKLCNFLVSYQKDEKTIYNFVCFEEASIITDEVHITLQSRFYDMIINKKFGFTAFELAEFTELSGKYTKTLYRILKQYRTTGTARFKWEEFCRIMNIPQNLAMRDIDKGILKPALKELTKKRNLFEQIRMPFVNLTYEKEKTAGRGRGGKVSGIVFTFKPESVLMQKLRKEELKIATDEQKCLNTLENMCGAKIKFKYENKILQIIAWDYQNLRVSLSVFKENDYGDFIAEGQIEFKKDNHKDFYQLINDFASSDILN